MAGGHFFVEATLTTVPEITSVLSGLPCISPAGYAIGLHLEFTTSKYIFQHYSKAWMDEYTRRGFILSDPTVRWAIENVGCTRWRDLVERDEAGVLAAAAEFGLKYGVSISIEGCGGRSLGSFASSDADFTDDEIGELSNRLSRMHKITATIQPDSPEDRQLKRLAAAMAHG